MDREVKMTELKPCPFCDGEAEIRRTAKNQLTVGCTKYNKEAAKHHGKFARLNDV